MYTLSRWGTMLWKNVWWRFAKCNNSLKCLKEFGIKLKAHNFFCKSELKYSGKVINSEGYRDDSLNIAAIENLKETSKNAGDLQNILALQNLYDLLSKTKEIKNNTRKNSSKKSIGQRWSKDLKNWISHHQKHTFNPYWQNEITWSYAVPRF